MDTIVIHIQIPRRAIAFLTFVLESYEGVATVRTIDPHEGIVELMVAPHQEGELREILKGLAGEFPISDVTPSAQD